MYIVTTISYDDLTRLLQDKRISLNNSDLFFGASDEIIHKYFESRIGHSGYVMGLRGRLNEATAEMFVQLDTNLVNDSGLNDHIILEAEIDPEDLLRFSVSGISDAAEALMYGLSEEDIFEALDAASVPASNTRRQVEILCVPYIKANSKIKVASLVREIEFEVEGITFVKLRSPVQ